MRDFAVQIREAIRSVGLRSRPRSGGENLLPVLEGVMLRRLTQSPMGVTLETVRRSWSRKSKSLRLANTRHWRMLRGDSRPGGLADALEERVEMLDQLRTFLKDRLLVGTAKYVGRSTTEIGTASCTASSTATASRANFPEADLVSRRARLLYFARNLGRSRASHRTPRPTRACTPVILSPLLTHAARARHSPDGGWHWAIVTAHRFDTSRTHAHASPLPWRN